MWQITDTAEEEPWRIAPVVSTALDFLLDVVGRAGWSNQSYSGM